MGPDRKKQFLKKNSFEGLENFPETLLKLFKGENTGKLVLKVGAEQD